MQSILFMTPIVVQAYQIWLGSLLVLAVPQIPEAGRVRAGGGLGGVGLGGRRVLQESPCFCSDLSGIFSFSPMPMLPFVLSHPWVTPPF